MYIGFLEPVHRRNIWPFFRVNEFIKIFLKKKTNLPLQVPVTLIRTFHDPTFVGEKTVMK